MVILSLTENGVTNYAIIITELMKAQAVNMLYMSVAWYYTSNLFKNNNGPNGNDKERGATWDKSEAVLLCKEIQYAMLVSILLIPFMGWLLIVAPYSYSSYNNSMFFLCAPMLFSLIALASSLWIQGLHLNDEYDLMQKIL